MSFQFNKIFAALLVAVLTAYLTGYAAKGVVHAELPETIAYPVADLKVAEAAPAAGGTPAAAPQAEPVNALLAAADPAAGQKVSRACTACHSFEKGGPDKLGPDLWGVVGRGVASVAGFAYSEAMQSHKDKKWTYEELNHFLFNPKAHMPGTKMAFAGVKKTEERAALIAWLRTLADAPEALPQ